MSLLKTKKNTDTRISNMKKNLTNPKTVTPLNMMIDSDLHRAFKVKTTTTGVSMTDIISEFIQGYVK
jgi:hypothetical protein